VKYGRYTITLIVLLTAALVSGCHHETAATESSAAASAHFKTYKLRGKVLSTNPSTGEVTLAHDAIPGFMEAMTMPYKLKDPTVLSELHPGDLITADLLVSDDPNADTVIDHIVVIGQGKPDYKPAAQYHVPSPGDVVPDFALTNQNGRKIHLAQFHGKAVVITFIYTSCPLPDFCPRVTRNFAELEKELAAQPKLYGETHLLSASFDPKRDTPAVLKKYGEGYMGSMSTKAFAHWDFAVADTKTLPEMARYFDVGMSGEKDGTITHTLSTTLIGPDGKVVQFYPGNDWTPQSVMADLTKLYPQRRS
jgi:protein SCO1/2